MPSVLLLPLLCPFIRVLVITVLGFHVIFAPFVYFASCVPPLATYSIVLIVASSVAGAAHPVDTSSLAFTHCLPIGFCFFFFFLLHVFRVSSVPASFPPPPLFMFSAMRVFSLPRHFVGV